MGLKSLLANTGTVTLTVSDHGERKGVRGVQVHPENISQKDMMMATEALIAYMATSLEIDYNEVLIFLSMQGKTHEN